jgi:hypothetical protein
LRRRFRDKILIIESDDWGLERGLNEDAIKWAKKKFGDNNFTRWTLDTLETEEDLDLLYGVLRSYRDSRGNHPVITANFITHNIDYSSSNSLKFIPISSWFSSQSGIARSYNTGIENGLIFPQLHGYSHFNISRLREYFGEDEAREAFENQYLTCRSTIRGNLAFLHGELSCDNGESHLITTAADVFHNAFGFRSLSLIPPTYIFDRRNFSEVADVGIEMIQGANRLVDSSKNRYSFAYYRKFNGFVWSARNARLDPYEGYDFYHEQCIDSIGKAFDSHSPAVIDFHRVNFSGKYNPEYRDRSLRELDLLLSKVLKKWKDVKFIHSQKFYETYWRQETK